MPYSQYYEEKLYPFQDRVLKILRNCELPFYLTGGTAVSRGYLNHRYSDGLDLFVNNDTDFLPYVESAISAFERDGFHIDAHFGNIQSTEVIIRPIHLGTSSHTNIQPYIGLQLRMSLTSAK